MRKTIHLIPSEDAGWLLPLFAGTIVGWARKRLADFGLDRSGQDRALRVLHRAVDEHGPLTRPELAERLSKAGFDTANEFKVHLWLLATLDGELCLGPDRGGQTCLVRTEDWIGRPKARPREDWLGEVERRPRADSLAELARRYLRGYGPATDRDFARWAGLPLRDGRLGIERIASELKEVKVDGDTLMRLKRMPRAPARTVVRLLGAFDNYNLGYTSRAFAVDEADVKQIVPGGGIVRPTITVDGRFVGTWSSRRSGRQLTVTVEPFTELGRETVGAIADEVDDLGRFEDLEARIVT
jgi:Winged helix DNA-binding domain